ncbi:MAG: efflux RND transporter periplasmic adaptor subunit [Acidobacteriia bacterium]|nr:efflux RND transporter periplasmic adaptor subunit [Terriglobia bacterium]
MTKQKLLLTGGAALLTLGLGAWRILRRPDAAQYRTAVVECGDIASTVSATGTPNAVVTVQVGSQVSGNILALYADFNTPVKKGQVVARIDPQIYQARVDQAKATLNAQEMEAANAQAQIEKSRADVSSAQASVANAQANAVRSRSAVNDAQTKNTRRIELVKDGVLSQEDGETAQATYDQAVANVNAANAQVKAAQDGVTAAQAEVRVAETGLAAAQAQVKQQQAALAQAQADLDHTYITAPVDGVVVSRNIDVGQTVAASLQAPTLFSIAQDLTKMQVDTNVSEADVGRVQVGMPATFTVDAYPSQTFQGTVTSIRKAAINVQNVVTYDVVISVANPDLKLFPGMTATVKILIERRANALTIPAASLRFRPASATANPKNGSKVVWVLDSNNQVKPVAVTLGLTDGSNVEVTSGLREGDRVIVASLMKPAGGSSSTPMGGGRRGPGF